MREHHLGGFDSEYYRGATASWTGQSFVPTYFEAAVRAPDVLVPASYEDRLPYAKMFLGGTLLPVINCEFDRFEGPWRFFFPS